MRNGLMQISAVQVEKERTERGRKETSRRTKRKEGTSIEIDWKVRIDDR